MPSSPSALRAPVCVGQGEAGEQQRIFSGTSSRDGQSTYASCATRGPAAARVPQKEPVGRQVEDPVLVSGAFERGFARLGAQKQLDGLSRPTCRPQP